MNVPKWIYKDDLVTWHRVYILWYILAYLIAMWTAPTPEPEFYTVNFLTNQITISK